MILTSWGIQVEKKINLSRESTGASTLVRCFHQFRVKSQNPFAMANGQSHYPSSQQNLLTKMGFKRREPNMVDKLLIFVGNQVLILQKWTWQYKSFFIPSWGQKETNSLRNSFFGPSLGSHGNQLRSKHSQGRFCGQHDGVKNRKENTRNGVEKGWRCLELNILHVIQKKEHLRT